MVFKSTIFKLVNITVTGMNKEIIMSVHSFLVIKIPVLIWYQKLKFCRKSLMME